MYKSNQSISEFCSRKKEAIYTKLEFPCRNLPKPVAFVQQPTFINFTPDKLEFNPFTKAQLK